MMSVAGVATAVAQQAPSLRIDGLVEKPGTFNAKSFATLKRHTLKVDDHGTPAVYEGVALSDVLALAGAPTGEAARGSKYLSLVVVAKAADDYVVSYSMVELDPAFTDRVVLLADRRDGKPLGDGGPFQIVVPGEKKHGRWIRQLVSLTVKDAR